MAKSIAKSCPLCLSVNDPIDMLPVTMKHSTPPQTAPLYLCRLCVIQIMKATLQSDVVDPSEVFGQVEPDNQSDPKLDEAPGAPGNREPEVGAASDASGNSSESVPVRDEEQVRLPADGSDRED